MISFSYREHLSVYPIYHRLSLSQPPCFCFLHQQFPESIPSATGFHDLDAMCSGICDFIGSHNGTLFFIPYAFLHEGDFTSILFICIAAPLRVPKVYSISVTLSLAVQDRGLHLLFTTDNLLFQYSWLEFIVSASPSF